MDLSAVTSWLGLIANLGVIAGLILVALQIRQNTEIAKAQVANDWFMADMQLEIAMMGENPGRTWAKAVCTPDELDHGEAAVLDRYFNYGVVQVQRLQKMHELGLADREWAERAKYLQWHLGNETGRRWWAHFRSGFPAELAQTIDRLLEDSTDVNRAALDALLGVATHRGPQAPPPPAS